jgi:type IV pilus assembly protein PilM
MSLFERVVVGIDFGHSSVKAVGVAIGAHPKVIGCGEAPIDPKYLLKDGMADTAVVAEALREAMKMAAPKAIKSSDAYAIVSEDIVFRKILDVPSGVNPDELPQVVRTEAVEYLPDEIGTLEIDYQPLGILANDIQQLMLVAVPKRAIEDRLGVFASAKLKPCAITPKPCAIGRACVSPQETEPVLLVDIGSEMTSISVYASRAIWVTGTVNMGGNVLKDAATGEVDASKKDAKLDRLADAIGDELSHVLKFFQNRVAGDKPVKQVLLSGGGSMIEGLAELIQKQTTLKVVHAKSIIPLPAEADRRFLGALGAALYPLYEAL